ncbi:LuxR C-terminal-related transcriptional regulator [Pseudoduganella sp. LjRoot289]|uniref:helix-turn-helix transcriptional regulator n=1 Tax=Pseudoduganella sp. LjRoot289 TaxID=3342314 RepID=UPI003ECE6D47
MLEKQLALQYELIGRLYDAALHEDRWPGLCDDIAAAFGASSAAVMVQPAASEARFLDRSANLDDVALTAYEEQDWQCGLGAQKARQLELSQVFASADIPGDTALDPTGFYAATSEQAGACYVVGAVFAVSPTELGVLGIHRAGALGNYAEEDKACVRAFLPHLERALQLRSRLAHQGLAEHCSVTALDALATAVFLLDADLTVLYANASAAALFGAEAPLCLRGAQLVQTASHGARTLARMVRGAMRGRAPGVPAEAPPPQSLSLPRHGRLPLTLTVAPFALPDGTLGHKPCAIVMARDPGAVTASAEVLRQLFDLTPAEASVSRALAAGDSLEEIAAASGVSVNTVKTHLHRVYGKTGTGRQGELVALIHGSTATLCMPHPIG